MIWRVTWFELEMSATPICNERLHIETIYVPAHPYCMKNSSKVVHWHSDKFATVSFLLLVSTNNECDIARHLV
jgi:hypothetical protein